MTTETRIHRESPSRSGNLLNRKHIDPGDETDTHLRQALRDTQGNILKAHGRNHGKHLFIQFTNGAAAKVWLAKIANEMVTSAQEQWEDARLREEDYRAAEERSDPRKAMEEIDRRGRLFVNLLLSSDGYEALGLESMMPDSTQGPGKVDNFRRGAKDEDVIAKLKDPPPAEWDPGFNQRLDALVMVAHDSPPQVDAAVARIKAALGGAGEVVHEETGMALRVDAKGQYIPNGPVREHFGYVDGVSQPQFFKKEYEKLKEKYRGKPLEYDPSARLKLVLTDDPGQEEGGYGTFFVYRKLRQNVHKFHADRKLLAERLARELGTHDTEPSDAQIALAGAYIVGRFPDGMPVVKKGSSEAVTFDNNFQYQGDKHGYRCPFPAHTRKVNPREEEFRANKIVRRAMSFGRATLNPAPDEEVGLLFLCAQASIEDQFEVQQGWSVDHAFPETNSGRDPIVNQAAVQDGPPVPPVPQRWPRKYDSAELIDDVCIGDWVTLRGAEYFFAPSLSFLHSMGGVARG